ncbi:MAG: alpha/beta hydrolase family protein [Halanaerobiales bacterium]
MKVKAIWLYIIITLVFSLILISSQGVIANSSEENDIEFKHPQVVQIDTPFSLEVTGLSFSGEVDLVVQQEDADGNIWSHRETYSVEDGTLVVDEEELMWQIQMSEPEGDNIELENEQLGNMIDDDLLQPSWIPPIKKLGEEIELKIYLERDEKVVGETTVIRTYGHPDIKRKELEDEELVAVLFEPPGSKPAPGVVVLHGSGGNMPEPVAYMLASNGFVVLALQYFGDAEGISSRLEEVPVEYVEKAGKYLLEHKRVKGDQIGLYGGSRGGELALLAASHFDIFGSVVAMVPSGVAWETNSGEASWTHDGEAVESVPVVDTPGSPPYEYEPYFTKSFDKAEEEVVSDAIIKVEKISGPVLIVSGGDDAMWNTQKLLEPAEKRFEEYDFPYEYRHLVYEEAGHAITYPYQPVANRKVNQEYMYLMGGNKEGYAKADADY